MKEYEYSIIRRVSRNPKRNREGRGVSESDLEALRQELAGDQRTAEESMREELTEGVGELTVSAEELRKRLKEAEEELKQKLGSEDFSKWQEGDFKQVLASELATSAQQTLAEALKRAGEMDKAIKVGERNLITRAQIVNATTDDGYGWVLEFDEADDRLIFNGRDYPQAKAGDTVTLSLLIRCDKSEWGASEWVIRVADSQGSLNYFEPNKEVFGEFYKHTWTFDLREVGRLPMIQLYNHVWRKDENGRTKFNKRIEAKYIKLERGTVATDWTPAPEDVEESVSKVNTSLTSLASTLLDPEQGEIHKLTSLLESHKTATDKSFATLTSQLITSAQQTLAEALKRAGEMDKEIKVGGRNLIRNGSQAKRQCGEWVTYRLYKPIEQSEPLTLSFDVVTVEKPPIGGKFLVYFFFYSNFRTATSVKYEEGKKRYSVSVQALDYNYDLYGDKKDYIPDAIFIYPNSSYDSGGGCFTVSNVKLERGTVATDWTPAPEDVAESVSEVNTSLTKLSSKLLDLSSRSLTLQQKQDLGLLTSALRLKMAGGEGDKKTLEGLTLLKYIALSGNNKDISAYLASDTLGAVLKAGITGFGTPDEREQVEITHQGTGHFGNLYFTGSQIDFKTGRDDAPYLSMGAEENQFITEFLATARLDDTPVSVGTVTLGEKSKAYEQTVSAEHDGTRLTVVIDQLEVAVYETAKVRLLLDNDVLDTWMGITSFREGGGGAFNGVPDFRTEHTPYKGSNLSYERVVKAGSHTLRLEIAGKMGSGDSGATIKGLRIKRRYDTGRQQSAFAKNGLRLFGSPERYFDVDYREMRTNYLPNFGYIQSPNPYLVRIKGGAKVDRLTVDELDMPGVPLCGASFDADGAQIKAFGKRAKRQGASRAQAVYDRGMGAFKVYHSIGNTKYIPIVQVSGWNSGDTNWSLTPRVYNITSEYFVVRILTNNDNPQCKAISYVAYKTE